MVHRYVFLALCFFGNMVHAQGLKSPEEFLGYALGEKFTTNDRIVGYFDQAAAAKPVAIKIERYGKTYENRTLLIACVSSPENIANLESIRLNSMRLAGMLNDKPADVNAPVIVWLSYNVHGNEASSSEVSMKVLYDLLMASKPEIQQWLKNTVVIIDPCLNPDGRDRYVNWYNQTAGKLPDPDPQATEHDEPWPSGRGNHYYFDLNRDWAWQTQVETQQRIKVYNKWMPSIHVDFHEQYPGNPYYFAPAAEPFHEVITPWQRAFQTTIGKGHAKYFDANGWLYFTREYFDLFYPAYGDTYPIYNGAIGMTYEQAGHGVSGLAIKIGDDTLTLKQRIEHHYVTSLSTIEVSSANAEKLNEEFRKYFDEGIRQGIGTYKTYVVSGATEKNKLKSLTDLFAANNISYSYAGQKISARGYNYFTGKEEPFATGERDILLSSYQPKSALLKVLFEPTSRLSDSSTYDITAWALPYAYGVQAYAVKEKLGVSKAPVQNESQKELPDAYGYLVEYGSFADGKLLTALLKNGIRTRYAEKNFIYNGKQFQKGTLVILRSGNESKIGIFRQLTASFGNTVTSVASGFMDSGFDFGSDKLHLVKKPQVALLTGKGVASIGCGEVWHLFEQQLNYPITLINASDVTDISLKNYDVLIIPPGDYKFLVDKEPNSTLKTWVRQGGRIIALENAGSQMATGDWGIKLKKEEEKEEKKPVYSDLKKFENRERDNITNNIPGAIYKVELDNSHPVGLGYAGYYFTLKLNENLYEFLKSGWNVGVIKKENQVSGFVGSKAKEKIQDGTVIAEQSFGKGIITYFADDPLFRSFWENGKLLFTNAVFFSGQ